MNTEISATTLFEFLHLFTCNYVPSSYTPLWSS